MRTHRLRWLHQRLHHAFVANYSCKPAAAQLDLTVVLLALLRSRNGESVLGADSSYTVRTARRFPSRARASRRHARIAPRANRRSPPARALTQALRRRLCAVARWRGEPSARCARCALESASV